MKFSCLSSTVTPVFSLCAAAVLCGCPSPVSPGVSYMRDITYGQGYVADTRSDGYVLRNLKLDVIALEEPGPFPQPAVLMVHGGSFEGGSRANEELVGLADTLALTGYVCFLMEYRLIPDDPPAPPPYDESELLRAAHAAVVDTKAAMRYVRENAQRYNIDPTRIGIVGESAGAIAGLGAALSDPPDFTSDGEDFPIPEINHPGRDYKPALMVDLWGTAREFQAEVDGADPPVFIAHGVLDTVIPFWESTALASWLEDAGVPYELYLYPFEDHGAWGAEYDGQTLTELVVAFLGAWL